MTATPARLDHGILNLPLSKRGDIDAQIDRFKAEQLRDSRAASKAAHKKMVENRATIRDLLAQVSDARLFALAAMVGRSTKNVGVARKAIASHLAWDTRTQDAFIAATRRELGA